MKRIILSTLLLMAAMQGFAQKISFESTTVNAGTTLWKRPITATFKFSNKDKNPLIIKDVDAGCGCMTTKWTNGNIQKGELGEISITYDAMLLGHLDRYIDVYTNQGNKPARIRMKALVSEREKHTIEELFPYRIDNICLSTNNIEFPDVHANDSAMVTIEILNDGQEVYTPRLMHLPSYITAEMKPEMLARGRQGKIELTLHGDKLMNYGLNQTNIYVSRFAGDVVGSNNELMVSSVLLPEINKYSASGAEPSFYISTTTLNLGKLGNKKKLTGSVRLKNNGSAPLTIDNIQAFNQAITVSLPKRELQPGESTTLKIEVWAKYLGMSKAEPRVLIITNDSKNPKEVLNIKFE